MGEAAGPAGAGTAARQLLRRAAGTRAGEERNMGKTSDTGARLHQQVPQQRVTFDLVLRQLRRHHFAVLSTTGENGRPASAGVNYGMSPPGHNLALYVMTRTHLQKARNIARNPQVALVVPLTRRFLWFLPPPTIQLHGRAEMLDWTDAEGIETFRRFWMGRRILEGYHTSYEHGERRICFLRITLEPVIFTYLVGSTIWDARRRIESAAARVLIPASEHEV